MEPLPDELKSWIAENVIAGSDLNLLADTLVDLGYSMALAHQEIIAAQEHPYMRAAFALQTSLEKRDSVLKTIDYCNRLDPAFMTLEKKPLPPFADFVRDYYCRNRPGLFSGAVDHWPARQWTPRGLVDKVGADTMVGLQQGRNSDTDYEINSALLRSEMRFGDFIDQVETDTTNNIYLTAQNMALATNNAFAPLIGEVGDMGDGYLDTSLHARNMFLWIGPSGTITPLHHDNTNNLFIQIYGRKRYRMIPALQVPYVYNHKGVFSRVDLLDVDLQQFPLMARTSMLEFVVEPGDFLFIPIAWWHHVVGETPSISLSFTNVNAPNTMIDYPPDSRY